MTYGHDVRDVGFNRSEVEKACLLNGHDPNVTVVRGHPVLVVCERCGKAWDVVERE